MYVIFVLINSLFGVAYCLSKYIHYMAHMVTVTIAGGQMYGPENDTEQLINADQISEIKPSDPDDQGNLIVLLNTGKNLYITETQDEIKARINAGMHRQDDAN